MLKAKIVTSLLVEKIYQFSSRYSYQYIGNDWCLAATQEPLYLNFLDYISRIFKDSVDNNDHISLHDNEYNFWWLVNEVNSFCFEINPDLPTSWLGIAKWSIKIDYIPSNFYAWVLPILEWFDLDRWAKAYHPEEEEYEAIKRDLAVVLEKLRNYPKDKLAPHVDEENWGAET